MPYLSPPISKALYAFILFPICIPFVSLSSFLRHVYMNARFVTSLSLKHYMILFYSLLFEIPYMNALFVTPIPKALMLFILSTTLPHDYMNAQLVSSLSHHGMSWYHLRSLPLISTCLYECPTCSSYHLQ